MDIQKEGISLKIPTPIYLYIFVHPFIAWFFAALGFGIHFFLRIKKENFNNILNLFKKNNSMGSDI